MTISGVAGTIAKVYLGQDAANQVLHGKITCGQSDRISAALWFSDLANFTHISDTIDSEEIIPMLNDYADAVISSVQEAGGEVLKLMGDGTLAIFKGRRPSEACSAALKARSLLYKRLLDLNAQRRIEGRPVTDVYLGLHLGEVFYGNIGSEDRLDFTVIGPCGQRSQPHRLSLSVVAAEASNVCEFCGNHSAVADRQPAFDRPARAKGRQSRPRTLQFDLLRFGLGVALGMNTPRSPHSLCRTEA